jgi:threonine dehydrogenase-like Zn-dependent dehydrogenase
MQFHHHGYVTADPRVAPASGTGIDRPAELPEAVDVLIVGAGPAGMLLAAQLSQYPAISTGLAAADIRYVARVDVAGPGELAHSYAALGHEPY